MRASRLILVTAFILLAACGGEAEETTVPPENLTTLPPATTGDTTTTTTTTAPPTTVAETTTTLETTTTVETTTTTVATTTTTTTAPPTTVTDPFVFAGGFPPVLGGPLDAHGSGCAPGAGPLPDGIWFGFATAWTTTSVEFDLACFYTGDAATAEAAARGEESPPPNDYIITNDNPTLRTVPVAADAVGWRLDLNNELSPAPFADFIADPGEYQACFDFCLMWLYVNGGEVTEIVSQFVP